MPDSAAAATLDPLAADAAEAEEVSLGGERRSLFIVVSGPGGTGKSTLIQRWLDADPTLGYVRNYTTRPQRPLDPDSGIDDADWFHFVSPAEFRRLVEADFFVQWANASRGYASGTPIAPLHDAVERHQDLVFDYTPQLFINLRRLFREHVVGVFIVPPSLGELRRRLHSRAGASDAQIELKYRMGVQDLAFMDEHDYLVVNDDLDQTLATLAALRQAETCRIANLRGLTEKYRTLAPRSMLFYYDLHGERLAYLSDE